MSDQEVRKAVVPAAGLGSRMRSLTHGEPKEMLPLGGKPMLFYCLQEALESGIEEVAVVISPSKECIKEYLQKVSWPLSITFLYQREPRGVADALALARGFVHEEPFALMMPDNLFITSEPALSQLISAFHRVSAITSALMEIGPEEAPLFGNCGGCELEKKDEGLYLMKKLHEKGDGSFPLSGQARALRTCGRQILTPDFFRYIEEVRGTLQGEIDDVPVMQRLMEEREVYGCLIRGKVFDMGNPAGFLAAKRWLEAGGLCPPNPPLGGTSSPQAP